MIPSETDRRIIHKLVSDGRQQARQVAFDIIRLREQLEELLERAHELDEFVDSHVALISPTRTLPEDILGAILVECLPSIGDAGMASSESPVLLCQICSVWRRVALSTPRLWAALHVVIPSRGNLENYDIPGLSIATDLSPVLAPLATLSTRWKNIEMCLPAFPSFEPIAHLGVDDLPNLRTISVSVHLELSPGHSPWKYVPSLDLPGLRNVTIYNGYDTSAALTQFTNYEIIAILRRCKVLESCHLEVSWLHRMAVVEPPVSLPHLSHLHIQHWSKRDRDGLSVVTNLVASMELANLRSLSLPHQTTATLLQGLELTPSLSELELCGEPLAHWQSTYYNSLPIPDPEFLAYLVAPGPTPRCPNLTRLTLRNFHAVSDETVLAFIQARAKEKGGIPLTHFTAVFSRPMQYDIMDELQPLIAVGLSVSLEYSRLGDDVPEKGPPASCFSLGTGINLPYSRI
ncbi:hypothetical protein B0H16DRAFT_1717277 [Mycena metata]|uniref:F-box domain-containing protein n=1 Tax=Mycena metata TaxID=1033252 RepID=A0AAD7JJU9_9AGAR|nr:hypothetical protein B0H16DRAFT_1717277 [Mycena metata]